MATGTKIRLIKNASNSDPPVWADVGREKVCVLSSRPEAGGPICLIHFIAGDGRDLCDPVDVRPLFDDFEDIAFSAPFVSEFTETLKAFVCYKPVGPNGNDRQLAVIDTGIVPEVTR